MIIPSIDLQAGHAVQLERGRTLKIDAGDPRPIAARFGTTGEIAVIDLDAAMGTGSNRETVLELIRRAPCRVGGGIRDAGTAREILNAGARSVILGTAATPDVLTQLPKERTIAALDAEHGEVVTHGWKAKSGERLEDKIAELRDHVGGFLITFVEIEGTMSGIDLERCERLRDLAGGARLTVAGGVKDPGEIAALDRLGIDAQIGMALYSGRFTVADALAATLTSDRPDGLWPTVVADESGAVLGLCYSNAESLAAALDERRGIYHSRTRGLWRKGESSGATQELIKVRTDCDRDALLFTVRQTGDGFCHKRTRTCFDQSDLDRPELGQSVTALARRLMDPVTRAAPGSYTARLFTEDGLLEAKLLEEAGELNDAASESDTVHEATDVLFFTLATLAKRGVPLERVQEEIERRAMKVTRRPGDRKDVPEAEAP